MGFNGKEGKPIPLGQAKKWARNYQAANPNQPKAVFFGKDRINELLNEQGCEGIRVYFGLDDDGNSKLILMSADANQNNIIAKGKDGGGTIMDDGASCPPFCPTDPDDPMN